MLTNQLLGISFLESRPLEKHILKSENISMSDSDYIVLDISDDDGLRKQIKNYMNNH
jgi:hypothetical protein